MATQSKEKKENRLDDYGIIGISGQQGIKDTIALKYLKRDRRGVDLDVTW
jgi:hypothetical protein